MEVIKEIKKCVVWYSENYSTVSIHDAHNLKSKLVTYLFNLSDLVSEMKRESLFASVNRKYEHHKFKSQLIEQKFTAAKAESKSIEQTKEYLESEAEYESMAYRLKMLLDQGNKVADDLQQRISTLKIEINNSRNQNTP
jgi:hypothetical protein